MNLEQFIEELNVYAQSTETITYYVSKAKGVVSVIAAHHFPDSMSCESAYKNTKIDFDEVQEKFEKMRFRYANLYLKTNLMDEKTAIHYDEMYNGGLDNKVKKEWRSTDYVIDSAISFKYPKKE